MTAIAAERRMVSLAEAAATLGVSEDTLARAADDEEIPTLRIRTRRLVPLAWLAHVTSWEPERPGAA